MSLALYWLFICFHFVQGEESCEHFYHLYKKEVHEKYQQSTKTGKTPNYVVSMYRNKLNKCQENNEWDLKLARVYSEDKL